MAGLTHVTPTRMGRPALTDLRRDEAGQAVNRWIMADRKGPVLGDLGALPPHILL